MKKLCLAVLGLVLSGCAGMMAQSRPGDPGVGSIVDRSMAMAQHFLNEECKPGTIKTSAGTFMSHSQSLLVIAQCDLRKVSGRAEFVLELMTTFSPHYRLIAISAVPQ